MSTSLERKHYVIADERTYNHATKIEEFSILNFSKKIVSLLSSFHNVDMVSFSRFDIISGVYSDLS